MDWWQSKRAYYFDFYFAPLVGVIACALASPSVTWMFPIALAAGFVLWTLIEYWTHRLVFHWLFRSAHDLHHKRPRGFDAVPPWMTSAIHVSLLCSALYAGSNALGLLVGLEIGYLLYIWTHDKIHHAMRSVTRVGRWLHRRYQHHLMHHQGIEANFGVAVYWWDRLFGTYRRPTTPRIRRERDLTSSP